MTNSTRKWRVPALLATAALGVGVFALGANPAQATADFAITRIAGADRAATAAQLALDTFPAGSSTAIIVRDDTFPDALAGNYMAGLLGAPILLSGTNDVPNVTLQALDTLNTTSVTLLGGPTALSEAVRNELIGIGLTVNRVAGADRFDTAARIALASGQGAVGTNEAGDLTAVLSSGLNFPDALAAGPIVYAENFPQLLAGQGTGPNGLPAVTSQALDALGIEHVIITGGPVALPTTIETALNGLGITHERIEGSTRYDTALKLAVKGGQHFGFTDDHVNFATGENFPDALAGGPHGGEELAATILVPPSPSDPNFAGVCDALEAIAASLASADAFGGPVAIPDAVLTALDTCGTTTGPAPGTGQIVVANQAGDSYSFVQASDNTVVTATYNANDTFRVDGVASTMAAFEAALSVGDDIKYTNDTTGADVDVHELTNRTVTSGMAGQVDLASDQFVIINPVTGTAVSGLFTYNPGTDLFTGAANSAATFEANISEGDTVSVTENAGVETYNLTNASVSGPVTFAAANGVDALAIVKDVFGDAFEVQNFLDFFFIASAANDASEDYTIGGTNSTYAQYAAALSVGDTLTYSRAGGIETFALVNAAPPVQTGQAIDGLDDVADTFSFVEADGDVIDVDYTAITSITVNGLAGDASDFEDAYTPGDTISFQAADAPTSTTPKLTLVDAQLQGQIANVDTVADEYDVLSVNNHEVLATIVYTPDGSNDYFLGATEVDLAAWEAKLGQLDFVPAPAELDDLVQFIPGGVENQHRLTTNDT